MKQKKRCKIRRNAVNRRAKGRIVGRKISARVGRIPAHVLSAMLDNIRKMRVVLGRSRHKCAKTAHRCEKQGLIKRINPPGLELQVRTPKVIKLIYFSLQIKLNN